jgi:hypothetical protein
MAQIAVRKYHHLGEGIDFEEVGRMKKELSEAMKAILEKQTDDSPVYTFIKDLKPDLDLVLGIWQLGAYIKDRSLL